MNKENEVPLYGMPTHAFMHIRIEPASVWESVNWRRTFSAASFEFNNEQRNILRVGE